MKSNDFSRQKELEIKAMISLAVGLIGLALLTAPATAVLVTETCFNATHVQEKYDYTQTVGGEVITYNYTQIQLCSFNCTSGKCAGTNHAVDSTSAVIVFVGGFVFMIMGMLFFGTPLGLMAGNAPVSWDTRLVARYLFFFVGLYLVFLGSSMFNRVNMTYGATAGITGAENAATIMLSIMIIAMLFFTVVDLMLAIVKWIGQERYDS